MRERMNNRATHNKIWSSDTHVFSTIKQRMQTTFKGHPGFGFQTYRQKLNIVRLVGFLIGTVVIFGLFLAVSFPREDDSVAGDSAGPLFHEHRVEIGLSPSLNERAFDSPSWFLDGVVGDVGTPTCYVPELEDGYSLSLFGGLNGNGETTCSQEELFSSFAGGVLKVEEPACINHTFYFASMEAGRNGKTEQWIPIKQSDQETILPENVESVITSCKLWDETTQSEVWKYNRLVECRKLSGVLADRAIQREAFLNVSSRLHDLEKAQAAAMNDMMEDGESKQNDPANNEATSSQKADDPLNIVMIVLQRQSRSEFIRHMTKSYGILRSMNSAADARSSRPSNISKESSDGYSIFHFPNFVSLSSDPIDNFGVLFSGSLDSGLTKPASESTGATTDSAVISKSKARRLLRSHIVLPEEANTVMKKEKDEETVEEEKELPTEWIWDLLRHAGYITAYSEDHCTASIMQLTGLPNIEHVENETSQRISDSWRDHWDHVHFSPFCSADTFSRSSNLPASSSHDEKSKKGPDRNLLNQNFGDGQSKRKEVCFGDKYLFEYAFDYSKQLLGVYSDHPLFSIVNLDSNIDASSLPELDRALEQFLRDAMNASDTMVVIVSLAGTSTGERYDMSDAGRIDSVFPDLFVAMPNQFLHAHPTVHSSLHANQRRLVTPYDVHASLLHVLRGSGAGSSSSVFWTGHVGQSTVAGTQKTWSDAARAASVRPISSSARSLFGPSVISKTRDCTSARIPATTCPCSEWMPLTESVILDDNIDTVKETESLRTGSASQAEALGLAEVMIDTLNSLTSLTSTCLYLKVDQSVPITAQALQSSIWALRDPKVGPIQHIRIQFATEGSSSGQYLQEFWEASFAETLFLHEALYSSRPNETPESNGLKMKDPMRTWISKLNKRHEKSSKGHVSQPHRTLIIKALTPLRLLNDNDENNGEEFNEVAHMTPDLVLPVQDGYGGIVRKSPSRYAKENREKYSACSDRRVPLDFCICKLPNVD